MGHSTERLTFPHPSLVSSANQTISQKARTQPVLEFWLICGSVLKYLKVKGVCVSPCTLLLALSFTILTAPHLTPPQRSEYGRIVKIALLTSTVRVLPKARPHYLAMASRWCWLLDMFLKGSNRMSHDKAHDWTGTWGHFSVWTQWTVLSWKHLWSQKDGSV